MPAERTSSPSGGARILVVDDDAAVRTLLRECFELEGYRVSEAASGGEVTAGAATAGERLAFAGWTLDIARRQLRTATGEPQELTTAEFNMLEMFLRRPSRVLSRDNIMDLLKGHEWSPVDRSIDALVGRLRKKVEPDPDHPRLIKTVRGVGYAFTADVRRL